MVNAEHSPESLGNVQFVEEGGFQLLRHIELKGGDSSSTQMIVESHTNRGKDRERPEECQRSEG